MSSPTSTTTNDDATGFEGPKTEAAETETAETETAETQAVETQAVETQAVETEAAETQAAETEVAETGTVEAEASQDPETATGDGGGSAEPGADQGAADGAAAGDAAASPSKRSGRVAELEREGEIAADFLETLLDIADLDGDLEVDVEGDRAAVAIVDSEEGGVPRTLVGAGAVVLEALQELTRLAVQAETGERSRLMLDVGGYRADRRATLVEQAQRIIGAVKESGERRELEPMSAFERKIVHDQVLQAGLVSESEGEEPQRFVVVLPS